ncbi:MAG TPA: DUF3253 domain-containing protein [Nocardioides sp.]|nr:DUF3253 domain-containing protein [Nocardioides sp.]
MSAVDPAAPESLASLILDLLHQRRAGATICPSDAARAAASGPAEEEWRPLMEPVRQAALTLVHQGKVEITQGGEVVDLATARGPIRIRLTGEDSVRDAEAGR